MMERDMYSCKITMQHKVGEQWPVVLEQKAAEESLEIRSEGLLSLDLQALARQLLPHDYGVMLGQALFQGAVRDAFLHARAQSEDRLSVQLFVEAPDLRALHWERLCAPFDEQWHFLMLDQRTPFTLALPSKADRRFPPIERKDLRALIVVACPEGLERYQLSPFPIQETIAGIGTALGNIPYDVLANLPDAVGPPTLDALCERLTTMSYPLLHIVCHGQYSAAIDDTVIYLCKEDQQVDPVVSSRLLERLSQIRGERGLPHFVFLATCESASPQAEGALGGLAQHLVRDLGIPAVLAMTDTVTISTAEALSSTFYQHLSVHGHLDLALSEACAGLAERPDCTVAALYSRLGAQPLFEQAAIPPSAPRQQLFSLTQQNRVRMLERVRTIWISGVLEQSLHGAAVLSVGMQEQVDAVTNLWRLVMQEAEQPARPLPPGTRITQVYDSADHELLILGAPGAGKTTLLLELTRDLLQRAKQDDTHPIPVVFHLSSWAVKRQPLKQWLMEELNLKYQVPRKLAQDWIETDQVLPLFDGLDEAEVDARRACIETINTYHQEHGFLPLVVASRSADYLAQTIRLRLTRAVTIQSLTQQQVDAYLARGGASLSALRVALQQDAGLRELSETPLMLSILTLTYHDMPVENLLQGDLAPTRQQIFDRYVDRMLTRGRVATYQREQTRNWLGWLANQLGEHNQTAFYLEQIQPDWLSGAQMLRWYNRLAVRLPGLLIGILVTLVITTFLSFSAFVTSILLGGLLGGLLSEGGISQRPAANGGKVRNILWWQFLQRLLVGLLLGLSGGLSYGLIYEQGYGLSYGLSIERSYGLSIGLIYGLGYGLIYGLCSIFLQMFLVRSNTAQSLSQPHSADERTKWQRLIRSAALSNGLLAGLLVGLSQGLLVGLIFGLSQGLSQGLIYGLNYGLVGGFLSLLLVGKSTTVQVTDRLIWSWTSLGRSLWSSQHRRSTLQIVALVVLSVVLSYGMSVVLSYGLSYGLGLTLSIGLGYGLSVGLIGGLSYWLLIGLFQGVSSEIMGDQQRLTPNQSIHRSAFNALVLGLVSTLIVGLIIEFSDGLSGLTYGLSQGLSDGLSAGLSVGLSDGLSGLTYGLSQGLSAGLIIVLGAGLLAGLLNGGLASWRHYVLCFLLWRNKSMPWNYPRFLDYAAEHILLRKVGGGYIFIHRFLLEYFAHIEDESSVKR